MSLYDEGLELDRMYQNSRADVEALQERCATLEQLVVDYRDFVATLSLTAIPRTKRDALQERATAALQQE